MKVVCIDTDIRNKLGGSPPVSEEKPLEYGKVYEGELIFNIDGIVDWNNNFLNLEGCGELEWFPTKNFVTLEVWREKILSEIGI
jgi:hypothetical protein